MPINKCIELNSEHRSASATSAWVWFCHKRFTNHSALRTAARSLFLQVLCIQRMTWIEIENHHQEVQRSWLDQVVDEWTCRQSALLCTFHYLVSVHTMLISIPPSTKYVLNRCNSMQGLFLLYVCMLCSVVADSMYYVVPLSWFHPMTPSASSAYVYIC